MRTAHFTLTQPDEPHFCPPWDHVTNVLQSLGFGVMLYDDAWNEVVPRVKDCPKPARKATPRTRRADALLEAIVEAVPTIPDVEVGDLLNDLCNRVRQYRDDEPKVAVANGKASLSPDFPDVNSAPAPRYAIDEAELKRRLHHPAGGPYAFGKAWDTHPDSPSGVEVRKALASETFKAELNRVVAHRLTVSHFEALSSVLDLLMFAATEGLI